MPTADPLDDFQPNPAGLRSALEQLITLRGAPGLAHSPSTSHDMPTAWPTTGIGGEAALSLLAPLALEQATRLDHPGFLAHMDPPTPWFTWAAAQWAASTNQNLLHPDVAPIMRGLEQQVISWLAPDFGMNGGHLVSGSTIANLTALWAARELRGVTEVVASADAHLSVAKAASILGLALRAVPVDADHRLRPELLGDLSSAALVLTAGTVSAGAVDPLNAGHVAHHAADNAAWVHVDAAWAGPLRFSPSHHHVLDGVESADSVGFSAHKWLHQPKDSAAVLFADTDAAHEVLSFGGGYLSAPNIGLLGSSGARALPLAATLLAWGRTGLATVIDAGMQRIVELEQLITAAVDFETEGENVTGVLLWRPKGCPAEDLVAARDRLDDAWVSTARINGETWLRSVGANPMADPGHVLDRLRAAIGQ